MQARSRINNSLKYANFVETAASKVKIDSYDGVCYAEHSGTTSVTTFDIGGNLVFIHCSNMWQTLMTNIGSVKSVHNQNHIFGKGCPVAARSSAKTVQSQSSVR